jgi:hypothetical protein
MSVEVCDPTTIGYYPSSRDGLQFHAASAFNDSGRKALPPGYPLKLNGPLVWSGSEIETQHEQWTTYLSLEELASIDDALRYFQSELPQFNLQNARKAANSSGLRIHPSEISPITFPLPDSLVKRLDAISEACYNGIGFGLIHGLDPDKYTTEENTLLYAGISACGSRAWLPRHQQEPCRLYAEPLPIWKDSILITRRPPGSQSLPSRCDCEESNPCFH